jgi:hypothetical protein
MSQNPQEFNFGKPPTHIKQQNITMSNLSQGTDTSSTSYKGPFGIQQQPQRQYKEKIFENRNQGEKVIQELEREALEKVKASYPGTLSPKDKADINALVTQIDLILNNIPLTSSMYVDALRTILGAPDSIQKAVNLFQLPKDAIWNTLKGGKRHRKSTRKHKRKARKTRKH